MNLCETTAFGRLSNHVQVLSKLGARFTKCVPNNMIRGRVDLNNVMHIDKR